MTHHNILIHFEGPGHKVTTGDINNILERFDKHNDGVWNQCDGGIYCVKRDGFISTEGTECDFSDAQVLSIRFCLYIECDQSHALPNEKILYDPKNGTRLAFVLSSSNYDMHPERRKALLNDFISIFKSKCV